MRRADAGVSPARVELLKVAEAAELLRCSPRTLRRRIAAGAFPVVSDGGRVLVRRCDLDAYVLRNLRQRARHAAAPARGVQFAAGSQWWRSS